MSLRVGLCTQTSSPHVYVIEPSRQGYWIKFLFLCMLVFVIFLNSVTKYCTEATSRYRCLFWLWFEGTVRHEGKSGWLEWLVLQRQELAVQLVHILADRKQRAWTQSYHPQDQVFSEPLPLCRPQSSKILQPGETRGSDKNLWGMFHKIF